MDSDLAPSSTSESGSPMFDAWSRLNAYNTCAIVHNRCADRSSDLIAVPSRLLSYRSLHQPSFPSYPLPGRFFPFVLLSLTLVTVMLLSPSLIALSPTTMSLAQYRSRSTLVEESYFCYNIPLRFWFDNIQGIMWWSDHYPVTP